MRWLSSLVFWVRVGSFCSPCVFVIGNFSLKKCYVFIKMLRFYNIFKLAFLRGFSVENPVETWVSWVFLGCDSVCGKKNNLVKSVTFLLTEFHSFSLFVLSV